MLTRLIKEGSNANDPTNIALSDYSRLENLRSNLIYLSNINREVCSINNNNVSVLFDLCTCNF